MFDPVDFIMGAQKAKTRIVSIPILQNIQGIIGTMAVREQNFKVGISKRVQVFDNEVEKSQRFVEGNRNGDKGKGHVIHALSQYITSVILSGRGAMYSIALHRSEESFDYAQDKFSVFQCEMLQSLQHDKQICDVLCQGKASANCWANNGALVNFPVSTEK
jgi:hypothetical protein